MYFNQHCNHSPYNHQFHTNQKSLIICSVVHFRLPIKMTISMRINMTIKSQKSEMQQTIRRGESIRDLWTKLSKYFFPILKASSLSSDCLFTELSCSWVGCRRPLRSATCDRFKWDEPTIDHSFRYTCMRKSQPNMSIFEHSVSRHFGFDSESRISLSRRQHRSCIA